ncbi:MAG TPA: translation elongation factor 4, partial [Candidatus Paceibacterota bacterium]|nr:translation elongation factor 4 [Candidatus Paceibacterota bacterium]
RGITIKMTPVRMRYGEMRYELGDRRYELNLIDTPGHSDFSYEVSRALAAVEGAVLLIDGGKGIQAQTLSNLRAAERAGLAIVPAVNKIDLDLPQLESVVAATADLLGVPKESVLRVSAKTGAGVKELLDEVVRKVPPPKRHGSQARSRGLVFDSLYDDHKGIVAFVRVFDGSFRTEDMRFIASGAGFKPKEVGYFSPDLTVAPEIANGEIGYVATGLKEPSLVKIGDTLVAGETAAGGDGADGKTLALPGYQEPGPVVFISFYPDGATKFDDLKRAFERLRLNDAALSFEPDANEALGRGLKVGFLGQLHFEITADRLAREYGLDFLTSFPSIAYRVQDHGKVSVIKQPQDFPDKPEKVWEPIVDLEILAPQRHLSAVLALQTTFDLAVGEMRAIGDNLLIEAKMPLRELIRDFDDQLKSVSQGYASFTYELAGEREAEVEKLEILIVEEVVPALTRIVPKQDLEREGRQTVERLKELLPQEQFVQAIQARSQGRIIARETIAAIKKKLGDFGKNGGDRTRKMKLWRKQERGKEKLQSMARVNIPADVFREILKK